MACRSRSKHIPRIVPLFNVLPLAIAAALCAASTTTAADVPSRYDEPFRPQFHFTPEKNWMNDPNGLVYFDGEYHLFYQYNPEGDTWGHMSWGHAVSRDLLRWEHLPVALREEAGVMIFSGSAVVDHRNTSGLGRDGKPPMVAIYTGHGLGKQTQNVAFSNDRGRTWTKIEGNPVIDINSPEFRDPKVIWHEPSKKWVMVVARPDVKKVMFYGSGDLKKWEQLGEFGGQGAVDGIWECPDLFPLPVDRADAKKSDVRKWVLVVNINGGTPAGGSGCQYFVGEFDGKTFRNDNPPETKLWADWGADFYAAVSWFDAPSKDGERTWIGWMSNWRYANQEPTKPWRTAQSIPRTLRLIETKQGVRLAQRPVSVVSLAQGNVRTPGKDALQIRGADLAPDQDPLNGKGFAGDAYELVARFENVDAKEFGLKLRVGKGQETVVGYDVAKKELFLDRTRSSRPFHPDFPARHAAVLEPEGNLVVLHVLVDRSSVEVFGGGGTVCITDVIFPDAASTGVSVYCKGGRAKLATLDAVKLKSAWR